MNMSMITINSAEYLLLQSKARKLDELINAVDACYPNYGDSGEELLSEYEEEFGDEPDLCTIGEIVVSKLGYL